MYLLMCLYQATKVRRHVFVKVPVPSQESETSCIRVRGIDFVTRSLVLCVCFVDHCSLVLLLLTIVLYVLFTDSDYSCGIFKFFLVCFYYIDFWTAHRVWYFLFFILFLVVCVCVCVCVYACVRACVPASVFKDKWWDFMHLSYSL